jgi:hypothetical protein
MHFVQTKNHEIKFLVGKKMYGKQMLYVGWQAVWATNKPNRSQTTVLLISYNSPYSHPRHCRGGPSGRLEQVLYFWPEFWLLFRVTPTHSKKKQKRQAF